MTNHFQVTATWQTPSGNMGQYTTRWFGPNATTVRESVHETLLLDSRRKIARALDITVTLETAQ